MSVLGMLQEQETIWRRLWKPLRGCSQCRLQTHGSVGSVWNHSQTEKNYCQTVVNNRRVLRISSVLVLCPCLFIIHQLSIVFYIHLLGLPT